MSAGTTPLRNIRVPDEVWKPALDNARHEGTDLTKVIVAYLRQYNRRHERAALKSEPGES